MAVQIPDPGTGNGQTGDNEYVFRKKVKDNFADQTNAASRLIGAANGQIPLAQDTFKAAFSRVDITYSFTAGGDCNTFASGTRHYVKNTYCTNTPPTKYGTNDSWLIETVYTATDAVGYQMALNTSTGERFYRNKYVTYRDWLPANTQPATYLVTTALGANTVVTSTGELQRASSSERYKDIISPLKLNDEHYAAAMSINPIVYRSKAEADNPNHHFYSFSAEALGAHDPAFTLWRETETVTDAEGNTTEQPLAERQAEGINLNAIVAFLHATNVKQDKLIKSLQEQVNALKPKPEV